MVAREAQRGRSTPQVVLLPDREPLRAMLTVRRGRIEQNPRNGTSKSFEFIVNERFTVLRAKIISLLEESPFNKLLLDDQNICFRASKGAHQHRFEIMTEDNYVALLTQRVKRVSKNDRQAWNNDIYGNLRFEFCVYCRNRGARATIHRATASRIRDTTAAVQQFQDQNNITLGPIAMNYVVSAHARQPNDTPFVLPDDNTTRQAMELDAALVESNAESTTGDRNIATIRLEINGNWTNFQIDVLSLRVALGLPPHDFFTQRIYHEFVPVDPPAEDIEDEDHREDREPTNQLS